MIRNMSGKFVLAAVAAALLAPSAATAAGWRASHPRRAEVNARLRHLNHRINEERREGDLTRAQAHQLHREDRAIRREERAMARFNHGHITKAEQRALNQQENQLSHRIPR